MQIGHVKHRFQKEYGADQKEKSYKTLDAVKVCVEFHSKFEYNKDMAGTIFFIEPTNEYAELFVKMPEFDMVIAKRKNKFESLVDETNMTESFG